MRNTSLPTELVRCKAEICEAVNKAYLSAPTDFKLIMIDAVKRLRADLTLTAEDLAARLGIARSTLFYNLTKIGVKYKQLVDAVKQEAEEALQRKLEKKEIRRAMPQSKQEFMERNVVKTLYNRMVSAGRKRRHINNVINFYYRLCKATGLSPEDFVELPREGTDDKPGIYDVITQFISDQASLGKDINNVVKMIQALQLWLGVKLLPPGVKQKEYKGKYQQAEIPLEIREEIVRELLDLYHKTKDVIYLRAIQAMVILYYTGSRRQALTNYVVGDLVTVRHEKFTRAMRTSTFRVITTLEKKDLTWHKLVPAYYDGIIPRNNFSHEEIRKISKIIKEQLVKRMDRFNTHTKLYIKLNKVYHIWRHTATREYLKALEYNRSLVAKLLGWVKDSNLVIYGDYDVLQLLGASGHGEVEQQTYLDFVRPELREELIRVIARA